jgi:hypothetical protein
MVCLQSAFFEFRIDFVPTKPLAIALIQPKPLLEEGLPR